MEEIDITEMMKPRRRQRKKIKTPQDEPRSGSDRSYAMIRFYNEDGTTTLEKHYGKVGKNEAGFFKTTAKYKPTKTARWVGGKSKSNPQYQNGTVVAYFAATPTTSGYVTKSDAMLRDILG